MSREKVAYAVRARPNFWAEKGKSVIDENYASLLGIDQLCSKLGISESHFRDVFQSAFGINPKPYLEIVQVEQAKKLLLDRSLRIFEIADRVGFKHRGAFQKTFKKFTGFYPSEYRKNKMKRAP